MFNKLILLLVVIMISSSCKKEEIEFDPTPKIEFIGISPVVANEYTDSVTVTIKYNDGDGDLGENATGVKNCFVTDNRIGITYEYRVKQLAPDDASIPIEGNLNIQLGGQGITDNSTYQSVSYTIYLKDRAGHQSNSITTSSITIRK
ncbi:MAG: hypothetical protein ACO1G9_09535 [Bacteroidota bacterium]